MTRFLAALFCLGCAPVVTSLDGIDASVPESDGGVPMAAPQEPIATPIAPQEEAPLAGAETDEVPHLSIDLPAISADGRTIAVYGGWNDYDAGSVVILDAHTGRVRRSIPYPEQLTEDEDGETQNSFDLPAMARLDHLLARGGYVSLDPLGHGEIVEGEGDSQTVGFTGDGVAFTIAQTWDDQGMAHTTLRREGREPVELSLGIFDDIDGAIAPDGSFVVLSLRFCACECGGSSEYVRLD